MEEIIKKYEKELEELKTYRNELLDEYSKKESKETRDTYYRVSGKIETLGKILLDLQIMGVK